MVDNDRGAGIPVANFFSVQFRGAGQSSNRPRLIEANAEEACPRPGVQSPEFIPVNTRHTDQEALSGPLLTSNATRLPQGYIDARWQPSSLGPADENNSSSVRGGLGVCEAVVMGQGGWVVSRTGLESPLQTS